MKSAYIQACIELLLSGNEPKTVFAGLNQVLTARGHEKLYPSVLRGVLREYSHAESSRKTSLVVTNAESAEKQRHAIESAIKEYNFEASYDLKLDPTIIGGFALRDNEHSLDKTYKRSLVKLYRSFS